MTTLLQDFRHAWRSLLSRPTYAAVTILVLALALGANTTVFSIFNGFFCGRYRTPTTAAS